MSARRTTGSQGLEDALLERGWGAVLYGGEDARAVPARKALALVRLADPHLPFIAITRSVRRYDLAAVVKGLDGGVAVASGPSNILDVLERELGAARKRRADGKAHRLLLAQQTITDHVAAGLGADALLTRVLGSLGETLRWSCGAVWMPDGDPPRLRCAATWSTPDAGPAVATFAHGSSRLRLAPGRGLPGRVFAFRRPAWIPDLRRDAQEPRAGAARHARLKAAVAVPVGSGEDCAGVLELFARELGVLLADLRFTPAEVVERVGGRIVEALEEPLLLGGEEIRIDPAIGFAAFPGESEDSEELLAEAARSADTRAFGAPPSEPWPTGSSSAAAPASSDSRPLRSTGHSG